MRPFVWGQTRTDRRVEKGPATPARGSSGSLRRFQASSSSGPLVVGALESPANLALVPGEVPRDDRKLELAEDRLARFSFQQKAERLVNQSLNGNPGWSEPPELLCRHGYVVCGRTWIVTDYHGAAPAAVLWLTLYADDPLVGSHDSMNVSMRAPCRICAKPTSAFTVGQVPRSGPANWVVQLG